MAFTFLVLHQFFYIISLTMPLLTFLLLLIAGLGQWVGHIEKWDKFTALYWSFITALTIGYGDIRPYKKSSRTLSLIIGMLGIMFTGIIVAITIAATTHAIKATGIE
ncbi:MAG: two pore domain potassium channel family protein [Gammaproteobacteria bacterium]|nr:MAG: two pore domain potassium channel family protein [Gammaproteobacteria bacterium]